MLVANARMYSVTPALADLWDALVACLLAQAGVSAEVIRHAPPAPIDGLWERPDLAAALMCGLPFSRTVAPRPQPLAALVPSPERYGGRACYMSDFVVRRDSAFRTIADTRGHRLGLTVPGSQSGCYAAVEFLGGTAGFSEVVGPLVTPRGVVRAVAEGRCDVGPVDSFAFDLMRVHAPELVEEVRVIATTEARPSPLFVASAGVDAGTVAGLRHTLAEAHERAESAALMRALLVARFAAARPETYVELATRAAAVDRAEPVRRLFDAASARTA